jgi:hypothetical protein
MPLLNDKLLVLLCKVLRLRQLANLQTVRLPELDARFHGEHGFARSMSDVDVDRSMLVAVEKESVAVLLEDPWHCKRLLSPSLHRGQAFENLPNVKDQHRRNAGCLHLLFGVCEWRFRKCKIQI